MSNMEKANRRLRRWSGVMGFFATVQLAFYWAVGLALCAFGGWLVFEIAGTF